MARLFLTFLVVTALFCTAAIAQTTFVPADNTRYVSSIKYKPIRVPFKEPVPAFYVYVQDRIIIKLADEAAETVRSMDARTNLTGSDEIDRLNKKYEVKLFAREFPAMEPKKAELQKAVAPDMSKYYIVQFNEKFQLEEVLKAYSGCVEVVDAEPVGVHPILESFPNDPRFLTDQWNYYQENDHDIDATDAWDHETGSSNVILGCLDTGLQYNVRDLGGLAPYTDGNVWINEAEYNGTTGVDDDGNGFVDDWVGWDFVNGASPCYSGEDCFTQDNEPTDFNGHGTHVSGIMGAITNNGIAVAGLAGGWNTGANDPANGVKIMACRIGWSATHPVYGEVGYVRMDFAAQAMYYAVNNGATAINCSWGSSNTGGIAAAVDYATAHGVIVVAAAGNSGSSSADYLGQRADVIDVCATDDGDIKADFSNYGTWVDLAAPGVDILSTYSYHYNPNYVAWISGTSQAAPHVTAAAGLLRSYDATLTRQEIIDLIINYTDDIDDLNPAYAGLLGSGRLNVFKSIDAAQAPTVTVVQPNGGEVLYIGQVYPIIWEASDNVSIASTLIEKSINSGVDWTVLADLPGNPGTWDWTVDGPPSDQCRIRVTCTDAVGVEGSDMSDDDFCPPYKRGTMTFSIAGPGQMPVSFELDQNYPNPFNPTTEIAFSLPSDSRVQLEVLNVLGQRVEMLVDEKLPAGEHSVVWDADAYASGVYFYRIVTEENTATRKMMLLK